MFRLGMRWYALALPAKLRGCMILGICLLAFVVFCMIDVGTDIVSDLNDDKDTACNSYNAIHNIVIQASSCMLYVSCTCCRQQAKHGQIWRYKMPQSLGF